MEKLKQLSKYIEPLRRMINKIDKNEGESRLAPGRCFLSSSPVFVNRQEEGPEQDEEPAQHPDRSHHQVNPEGCAAWADVRSSNGAPGPQVSPEDAAEVRDRSGEAEERHGRGETCCTAAAAVEELLWYEEVVFCCQPTPPPVATKQQYLCQPLLDAVMTNIRSPVFNHSLYRTFAPAMSAIHGPPIRYMGPVRGG